MAVFEKGTYLTVGELKEKLGEFDDSLPVCKLYDGRAPLINVIPSLDGDDNVALVVLYIADDNDLVEVDM